MIAVAQPQAAIRDAYATYTLSDSVRNSKVACMLVIVLMPIGYLMDHFVYPEMDEYLFILRLMTSAVTALFLVAIRQPGLAPWKYRLLCPGWYVVPAIFICWMIRSSGGASSTYYAGLNLVILAVSSVVQATVVESVVAVSIIVSLYLGSCFIGLTAADLRIFTNNGTTVADWRMFTNNITFTLYTCSIVITGNYFYNRLRFREFCLRYELDENRRQLEENNQKLMQMDEVKNRFFANISHELRTPLTLLLAPLENLIARFGRTVDDETRGLLHTMQSNGMRLLKLINDLLDLVRLDSGVMQVRREALAIGDFLRGLASAARQVAQDKRIQLETVVSDDVGSVQVDRDKLEKIILNLQFNALKFTPAGGRVELRARREGEHLVLQVVDNGMGIPENHLPNVFDRFFQVDTSSRRKYQGVGIGLSLVKELVEIQGGTVAVESKESVGTTFTVRLPYLAPEAVSPETDASGQPPADGAPAVSPTAAAPGTAPSDGTVSNGEWVANLYRRAEFFNPTTSVQESMRPVETARNGHLPKALVADDEPDMLKFLKSQLSSHYQILEAVDGQQAIEKATQFLPDVILLDMMMPEKDGLEACRELRQRTSTQSIPIILLTARADEATKLASLDAGANDFLAKPFSTTELHVRVKNLVESYQYQRTLSKQKQKLESTIDQLKDTETQLVQTEKLASLGRLSAGIIHEINNPLNFASTGLYTLRSKARFIPPEERDDYAEILKDVEEGISRVKSIVSDLRTFTHPGERGVDQVNVWEVVSSALRFSSQEWKDKVAIQTDIPADLVVWGEKNKLIQVMINLLQNSLDALKEKSFSDDKPAIAIVGRAERGRSFLTVRDNGNGIEPQIMDKIFDPFFTTKEVGQGMGLGLSICYRIVQDFGGRITVDSKPGQYCEFVLEFPEQSPQTGLQA
jgi:signal transduction histidine kinase